MTAQVTDTSPTDETDAPLLAVDGLKAWFKGRDEPVRAVDGVSFAVERGSSLGIVGESGSGKSVTAFAIAGLLDQPGYIAGGTVRLRGRDITALRDKDMRKVRGREIGMVFQEPMAALNPVMTVGSQLIEAIRAHDPVSKAEASTRALALLEAVGIPAAGQRLREYPNSLSGGMRQRVVIAIAMANNPALLILDEPTTALDVTVQAQILDLVKALREDHGTAAVLISHDMGVVADFCDRVVVMYGGRVMEEGAAADVVADPKHPYTQGLLASIPGGHLKGQRLSTIQGSVPSPSDMPPGCPFSTRCIHVMDRCSEQPPSEWLGGDRRVACWLHSDGGANV